MILLDGASASGTMAAPAVVCYITYQKPLFAASNVPKKLTLRIYLMCTSAFRMGLVAATVTTDMGRPGFA